MRHLGSCWPSSHKVVFGVYLCCIMYLYFFFLLPNMILLYTLFCFLVHPLLTIWEIILFHLLRTGRL